MSPVASVAFLKLPASPATGPWHRLLPLSGTEAPFAQGALHTLQSRLSLLLRLVQITLQTYHCCSYTCIYFMPPSPTGFWGPLQPGSLVPDIWQLFHKYFLNELTNIYDTKEKGERQRMCSGRLFKGFHLGSIWVGFLEEVDLRA